ncbi:MAG: glucokinase [Rhodospirillales bacterium]|nr:glucokinase [Rhodospirillales bacterium]
MTRILLGDIGGTNARFAALTDGAPGPIQRLRVADHATPDAALQRFIAGDGVPHRFDGAILAVAGHVDDGRCALTNGAWTLDASTLGKALGGAPVHLINDHEAIAWALPRLTEAETLRLGTGGSGGIGPMVVVGPGTGLGVACIARDGAGRPAHALPSEGGHATLAPVNEREDAIVGALRRRFGHVSAERVLSGPGLVNLYDVLARLDGVDAPRRTAAEITEAAVAGACAASRAALDAFCGFLGAVAGDFALTFGARGGVYIAGGIVPRLAGYVAASTFRERFEDKGRLRPYLAAIPTRVVLRPDPAFLGLASLAARLPGGWRDEAAAHPGPGRRRRE